LDLNIDTHPYKRRMERLWLRPLSRDPKKQYLKLAKKMAAHPIEQGTQPRQKYFFNLAASLTPKKKTLAWVVDQMQRREAVRNVFWWLTVRSEGREPQSMTEFFAINMDRFAGPGQKQLQVFGASVDKKIQIAWVAPSMKSVTMLERVQHLITPMVRYHFNDIVVGGRGYRGFGATVGPWSILRRPVGIGKWMCPAQRGGATKEDFLFVVGEGYFRVTSWRSISPAYGYSIAGGVPLEGRMYIGWRSSTAMLCST
jgi:hypothetical protein